MVATSILTARATTKAADILEGVRAEKDEPLTKMEIVKATLPTYIPPFLMGVATVSCIFGANALNKRQQASLVSAYVMLDQYVKDYKTKVNEVYGEDADTRVKDEIAKDKFKSGEFEKKFEDTTLFYDELSGRYFESSMKDVMQAEYEINRILTTGWGASLNEFYELLGLPGIVEYDELGWSVTMMEEMYWHAWIEFNHRKVVMDDGTECYVLEMPLAPFVDYLEW